MNNPPDISQDPAEHEEYAHNVQKQVRGYLTVGALLLAFTGIPVVPFNVVQIVAYHLRDFLNAAGVGRWRLVYLGQSGRRRAGLSRRRGRFVRLRACPRPLWRLVLSKNETATHHHMKKLMPVTLG